MPRKLPDTFLKERYESDVKYIFVYDTYRPDFNKTAVTSKFYSKYEGDTEEPDPQLLEKLKIARDFGPKDKRRWPETTNQCYGWFNTPFIGLGKSDSRLYFPQKSSEMTRHGIALLMNKPRKPVK